MDDLAARTQALDPTQSFIVQAPAGSGKTELLTQRYLKLLALQKAPEEILAVTFTRKAASQMRQRIIMALQMTQANALHEKITYALASQVLARDKKLNWQLIENPNRLRIVTIDALCATLVNKMPILSDCGGLPEVSDFAQDCYQQAVELLLETDNSESWSQALGKLLLHLDNRISILSKLLIQMLAQRDQWLLYFGQLHQTPSLIGYLQQCLTRLIDEHLQKLWQKFLPFQEELMDLVRFAAKECWQAQIDHPIVQCKDLMKLPAVSLESKAQWEAIVSLLITQQGWRKALTQQLGFPSPAQAKDKAQKALRKLKKEQMLSLIQQFSQDEHFLTLLMEFQALPAITLSLKQQEIIQALAQVLPVLVAFLQVVFQEKGKVDFIEINLRALQALGDELNPSEIALKLDYQLKHILIDEYQDTSVPQYRLFEKLVMGWQVGDGRTLFLVGDPMQSIYRFRGAEVSLFLYTQQHGLGEVKLTSLNLTTNFRSNQNIVNWINQTFVHLFPQEAQNTLGSVCYSPAVCYQMDKAEKCVHFYPLLKGEGVQAQKVVELIEAALTLNSDTRIVVLVRAKKHLALIIQALKKKGLAFVAYEAEHLTSRNHVMDLFSLLRAMSDWSDSIAWYALLRAPWIGLALADLLVLAQHNQSGILWQVLINFEKLPLSQDGLARLKRAVPVIQYWLQHRLRHQLHHWLKGLWIALGGLDCYTQVGFLEDIEQVLHLISEYEVAGQIADIEQLEQRLAKLYGDVAPSDLQKNTPIELMTIHKAKGLEFDVVIMPHLEATILQQEYPLLAWLERSHKAGIDLLLAAKHSESQQLDPWYRYVCQQLKRKNEYEADRVLYVAATRAKRVLHLIAEVEKSQQEIKAPVRGSFLAKLWSQLQPVELLIGEEDRVTPVKETVTSIRRLPRDWRLPVVVHEEEVSLLALSEEE